MGPFEAIGRTFNSAAKTLDILDDGLDGIRCYSKGFADQAEQDNKRILKRSELKNQLEDMKLEDELDILKSEIAEQKRNREINKDITPTN